MPKIIKSIKEQALYDNAPKYFLKAKTATFSGFTYIALADDGFIYEIGGETGYEGGWNAKKFKSNPNAKDKTNFYEMLIDSKYTEQESQCLRTKKELIEALEAGTLKWKKDKAAEEYRKYKNKKKSEVQQIEVKNSDQPPIPNSQLKDNDKKTERAEVEYLSPSQTVSRNSNYVTIKNNFVSSENKKSESSFPFYFLRVLAGRIWIFISVTTFVFNFGQVLLCSKFEPIGFLFLIFTYCLSVWAVNTDKSNNRAPSFSYFLIPRGKLNKIIFYTALSLAILSIFGAASDMNSYCQ